MYHFHHWAEYDLKELWIIMGQGGSTKAVPIHTLANILSSNVIDVLPAVHALSGCDTTSKVGTKKSALKVAEQSGHENIKLFGREKITQNMVSSAEKYLVSCLSINSNSKTFDELRYETYHKRAFQLDFEKLPCTSKSIILHIKRAYYTCYRWCHVPFMEEIDLNPINYGYYEDVDENLVPEIIQGETIPNDFPIPCNCIKCAKSNVCPCRVREIHCCEYCKCSASVNCKNPVKS